MKTSLFVALALLVAACAALETSPAGSDDRDAAFLVEGKLDAFGSVTEGEQAAVLRLANTASFEVLDDEVGLDRRAAENIVAHRVGRDGVSGTSDDDPYDSLAELDAVAWVGPSAFEKLLAYARALAPVDEESGCLIISEYVEGSEDRNKFLELYNCGSGPLQLEDYNVCLVRNDATTCTLSAPLDPGVLGPGEVVTLCRSHSGSFSSPFPPFRDRCQQPLGSVLNFSGDDRMVVYRDADADGAFDAAADVVMDVLGRFTWRPSREIWSNLGLRRCNLTPNDGQGFYQHTDYFTEHRWSDYSHFGVAPDRDCAGRPF